MRQLYRRISHFMLSAIMVSSMSMAQAGPLAQPDNPGMNDPLIARLDYETGGHMRISYHAETGKVRFVGADLQHTISPSVGLAAATPELVARSFLSD